MFCKGTDVVTMPSKWMLCYRPDLNWFQAAAKRTIFDSQFSPNLAAWV